MEIEFLVIIICIIESDNFIGAYKEKKLLKSLSIFD